VPRRLVELEILKAGFSKVRNIELGALNGVTNLTYLSMEGNEVREIIPGTIEMISCLEYLD
jgi:Leucine-rich repeat (LRR) protein